MMTLLRILVAALSLLSLTSCDIVDRLAELESRSFTLSPTLTGVHHTGRSYTTGPCPFLQRRGTGSVMLREWRGAGGLDRRGMLVGFSSSVFRGADPAPCNLWVHHAFQGKAFFDLEELPPGTIVESARLTYTSRSVNVTDFGPASPPCVYVSGFTSGLETSAYAFRNDPADRIGYSPTRPASRISGTGHDITSIVARWANRGSADNWLTFSVRDGRAFVEHSEDDIMAYCAMHLDDVTIEVTALVPPGP